MMRGGQDPNAAAHKRCMVDLQQEIARLRNTEAKVDAPEIIGPRS